MFRDYKVYFNDSYLLLTSDSPQINKNFSKVLSNDTETSNFLRQPDVLFDGQTNGNILAICNKPGEMLCNFMEQVEIVIAGGGLVKNEHDELLLIHRRGKWDMAKGKIEMKEDIMAGALREVEEETGVKIETVEDKPIHTYHAYTLKGKRCLKETCWYHMQARAGQNKPVPQTEEGIDEVRWVKKTDLHQYQNGCFLLVWDLMRQVV